MSSQIYERWMYLYDKDVHSALDGILESNRAEILDWTRRWRILLGKSILGLRILKHILSWQVRLFNGWSRSFTVRSKVSHVIYLDLTYAHNFNYVASWAHGQGLCTSNGKNKSAVVPNSSLMGNYTTETSHKQDWKCRNFFELDIVHKDIYRLRCESN